MIVADSSVAVPAALPWHEHHTAALRALPGRKTPLLAHVGIETYSVLTRLPNPHRRPPSEALSYLQERFLFPPAALTAETYENVIVIAADRGIVGGAVFDALIGAAANELGAKLITLDRRAAKTYDLLHVDYELVA